MIDCKSIREKYTDMNRSQFAKACGINNSTYFYYENGRTPDIDTLIKISKYLGVSLDILLDLNVASKNVEEVILTPEQKGIIELTKKLNDKQSIKVYNYLLGIIDAEK